MRSSVYHVLSGRLALFVLASMAFGEFSTLTASGKTRVIVTSDGEIDDECSMVRFLLYANEWHIEGIITSSSQYHWQRHRWAGDDWVRPYLDAYARVYPNLVKHDPAYPTPEYLRSRTALGNVKSEGDMDEETAGSQLIVRADSAKSRVTIMGASTQQASYVVPNEAGEEVHIILEVTDDGAPPLVRYQRVICDIQ